MTSVILWECTTYACPDIVSKVKGCLVTGHLILWCPNRNKIYTNQNWFKKKFQKQTVWKKCLWARVLVECIVLEGVGFQTNYYVE